jgi:hypothetical protein
MHIGDDNNQSVNGACMSEGCVNSWCRRRGGACTIHMVGIVLAGVIPSILTSVLN